MKNPASHIELLSVAFLLSYLFGTIFGLSFLLVPNGWFMLSTSLLISFLGLLSAYGLFKKKAWGRTLALITSVPGFMFLPVGTICSIYAFWVLSRPEAKALLLSPEEQGDASSSSIHS